MMSLLKLTVIVNKAMYNTCKCCKYKWIFLTNIFSFTNYTYSILKIYCTEEYDTLSIHKLYFLVFFLVNHCIG